MGSEMCIRDSAFRDDIYMGRGIRNIDVLRRDLYVFAEEVSSPWIQKLFSEVHFLT